MGVPKDPGPLNAVSFMRDFTVCTDYGNHSFRSITPLS